MIFFLRYFLALTLFFAANSCSQKPAQISDHSSDFYNKSTRSNPYKYSSNNSVATSPSKKPSIQNNQIEVAAGDTIFGISRKLQIPLRDLITQNNLTPPYNLNVGDRLSIPTTKYHEVKTGETLYGISRTYNMQISNLVELNNLHEPYAVKVGDKIKISSANNKSESSSNYSLKSQAKSLEKEAQPSFVGKVLDKLNHFSWPVRGTIVSGFGPKSGGLYNDGINIKAKEGTEVKASEDGVVAYVGNELKGYGNLIIIKHSGGWITAYAHLAKTNVARGAKVKKGQKIGLVGSTGNVTSSQLYFGLRKGRDAVNPKNYLK
jgi:murein DD-endopeptidase MepM/ murein hydrolase activator NlpD